MARGKTGGDEGKKKVILSFLEEAAEFATGVIAGGAVTGILRAGASGLLRGLKGGLFEKIFGSTRGKNEEAKAEDLTSAPKNFGKQITEASGDARLGQLAQDHVANAIAIQVSSRSEADKAEALRREQERYKAAVNEYLLSKTRQSLQSLMTDLSEIDNDPTKSAAKKFKTTTEPARPDSYRADFFQWLQQELSPSQRAMVMARRGKITVVRIITDMLDFSANFAQRFDYIIFALGEPDTKEVALELYRTAMAGCLDEHPLVKRAETWSQENVTERQTHAEMMNRAFSNRRRV